LTKCVEKPCRHFLRSTSPRQNPCCIWVDHDT
jgi:hypothetical protein